MVLLCPLRSIPFFLAFGPVRARRTADRKEDTVIKRSSFRFIIALWRDRASRIRFQVRPQRSGGSRFPARLGFLGLLAFRLNGAHGSRARRFSSIGDRRRTRCRVLLPVAGKILRTRSSLFRQKDGEQRAWKGCRENGGCCWKLFTGKMCWPFGKKKCQRSQWWDCRRKRNTTQ